jgi:type II secretory pathway pseudopilin PulG
MGRLRLLLVRRLRRRGPAEGGFTLFELVLASGVIALVMSSLAYMGTVAFKDAALARNRQVATGLASEALEQVRALPYDTVALGLSTADLAAGTDSNVTVSGGVYKYNGETIPNGTSNTAIAPLAPHRTTKVMDTTPYTVAVYVTYLDDGTTSRSFRVTAHVSWATSARGGVQTFVDAQTIVYSPTGTGCSSTATHPFAAPCQPFLYGIGSLDQGSVAIAPYTGSAGISCLNLKEAQMVLPSDATNMQLEQIESVDSAATTSGVNLTDGTGAVQTLGQQSVKVGSDSDPSQSKPVYATQTTGTGASVQASGSVSMNGCSNSLSVGSSGGDTASATATVLASATNVCPNSAVTPVNMVDLLPCGNAAAKQAGSMSAQMNLNGLGSAVLASIGSTSTGGAGDTNFDAAPQTSPAACTVATSGDGCIHASQRAAVGSVRIGGLASSLSAVAPLGFDYLVKLDNFTRTVTAEAGVGNDNPSVSSTGTIQYWNGAGYTSVAVGSGASVSLPLASLTVSSGLTSTTLSIGGTIRTGGTTSGTCASPCADASASAESPIVGDIRYTVIVGGNTVADLLIHIDFGTATAHAQYTSGA